MAQNILLKINGSNVFPVIKEPEQVYQDSMIFEQAVASLKKEILTTIYPVGSILTLDSEINPNDLVSGVYWESYGAGKIIVGQGYLDGDTSSTYIDTSSTNSPVGEYSVALTVDTIPSHSHGLYKVARSSGTQGYDVRGSGSSYYTTYQGGGGSHNNLMPYKVVRFWRRVAEQSKGAALDDFSWGQIKQIASEGKASEYWSIGDTKIAYTTTGEALMFQIVDFREEQINEQEERVRGIVFEAYQTLKPNIEPNHSYNPWASSNLANYLDNILLKNLPQDLAQSITPVYKNHLYFDKYYAPTTSTMVKEKMTLWIASAKEKGATTSEYIETDDKVFSYYSNVETSSTIRGKDYLWDNVTSYYEMHRSTWWDGEEGYYFSDLTQHSFADDGTATGTLMTQRTTGIADIADNYFHFAPCFFIGGGERAITVSAPNRYA